MRTVLLFLLSVALTTLAELQSDNNKYSKRAKRWIREDVLSRSKRRWVLSTIELQEEEPGPYPKEAARMFNNKIEFSAKNHKFKISGMGVTEEPLNVFSIDEHTGVVSVHRALDREKKDLYHIKFDVFDKVTNQPIDKELAFDVEIKDINDNPPRFLKTVMQFTVNEDIKDYLPVSLQAFDNDQPNSPNSRINISLISQNPKEPKITVEQSDTRVAQLRFRGCFDYDKANKYTIIVEAKDNGIPQLSSSATINLFITDRNSYLPTFKERKYHGEVLEMETKVLLRVAVEDKDKPKTPAWQAKYYFIRGNEGKNYNIETDPNTNEGILSVVKGKDFERTTFTVLQLGVMNEEELHVCHNGAAPQAAPPPQPDSVNITIKVIDVNDPPEFDQKKVKVYHREEESPGKVLHTPKVHDVDSDLTGIRYVLQEDPAKWVSIDEKTGALKSAKKMDRESPFVNNSIYKVVIAAIDDGEPSATGSCTILVHLGDINDNSPKLVHKSVFICGNKANKVMVPVEDTDNPPFSGPFGFSLGDDEAINQQWKLDPASGQAAGLISKKTLAYGNYSVPMTFHDQQGVSAKETLEVLVCDCENKDMCRKHLPLKSSIGAPGIGLIFAGLLLFLLLLLVILCRCGTKSFKHIPVVQDEGNQTLIKYNQEGGGSECKSEPVLHLMPTEGTTMGGAIKQSSARVSSMSREMDFYNTSSRNQKSSHVTSLGRQQQGDSLRYQGAQGAQGMYSTMTTNRMNSYQNGSSKYFNQDSQRSNQHIVDHLDRRLYAIGEIPIDHPAYQPHSYAHEGQGSKCDSLEALSVSNLGDDLHFLNALGPRFQTLGGICHKTFKERNVQL